MNLTRSHDIDVGTCIFWLTNSSSTIFLSLSWRPAWCKPTPNAKLNLRFWSSTPSNRLSNYKRVNRHDDPMTLPEGIDYLFVWHVQPLLGVVLSCHKCNKIKSRQSGLTTRRHKYQNRFVWWVSLDGRVSWLVHGGHSGTVVFAWETIDVDLQLDRPHRWMEVEQPTLHR